VKQGKQGCRDCTYQWAGKTCHTKTTQVTPSVPFFSGSKIAPHIIFITRRMITGNMYIGMGLLV